ncbi:MAG: hypothetical protein Q8Q31_04395 [Nanoarchaeota archaeon]|nr:hypothetical protein [Nanoarchaeota archaeon]
MRLKEIILNIIGVFLIVVGVVAILYAFYLGTPSLILWFCYMGSIMMGLGVLRRSNLLILSQVNILLIPALVWSLDLFYILVFQDSFLGITDYFFREPLFARIISLQHIYNVPLALIALFIIGKNQDRNIKYAWKFSFAQVAVIFVLSRIFLTREDNVNWAYYGGFSAPIVLPGLAYAFLWFIGVFLMILLTHYAVAKIAMLRR